MVVIKLPPDNLGSRHRALNARVNEAATSNVSFDTIKVQPESSEVDKLYKIDLAAKYKNVPYIIEILKSGDSLYTSRALKKCVWLYEDEYASHTNPKYLQESIFPFTSNQMKRKIIKTVAANLRNPERAAEYFHYCLKEKMKSTAFTCFLYTTQDFKLYQLRNNKDHIFQTLEEKDMLYFRFFIRKSFILLDALLDFITDSSKRIDTLRHLKKMFAESEENYLDIAEKHLSKCDGFFDYEFDTNMSNTIIQKHKKRVLDKPKFYVNTINKKVLVKNSTIEDAKIYATALLPDSASQFWYEDHLTDLSDIYEIIPNPELYSFFKNHFAQNYPDTEFETDLEFYDQEYYKFMSSEQREQWALDQLKSEKQLLGVSRDFLWYRFINFEKAFEEIKKHISITKHTETRCEMLEVLVESAKNDRELETLFKYYNKRHMNEGRHTDGYTHKYIVSFIDEVYNKHNVFEFDEDCWTAFSSIVLAKIVLDYNEGNKIIAILWHILHDKNMPQELLQYLLDKFRVYNAEKFLDKITDFDKKKKLHEYLFTFYMNIIKISKDKTFEFSEFKNDYNRKLKMYFENMEKIMKIFNENGEIPKSQSNPAKKKRHVNPQEISGRSLLRDLKKDKELVISKLGKVQNEIEFVKPSIRINTFLKKMRIYFPDDVAKIYLDMFKNIIINDNMKNMDNVCRKTVDVKEAVKTGVNAIFQLADEDTKIDFIKKYYPVASKEERKILGIQHERIQRAIYRYACTSRPPVPPTDMLMYMKGNYIKHCLHIFNKYFALLPLPMCQQLVHLVMDTPVSIQKHAIRLAFRCLSPDNLKEAIVNAWKNTKNISLRGVIYNALYKEVVETKEKELYAVLETITVDLNHDDEDAIFDAIVSCSNKLPEIFLGYYVKVIWETIDKFKDLEPNITRKKRIVLYMIEHIHIVSEEHIMSVVNEHIHTMITENKLNLTYSEDAISDLYIEKWNLTAKFIMYFYLKGESSEECIQLALYIVERMNQSWDQINHQKCCWDFVNNLKKINLKEEYGKYEDTIPIFECILKVVDKGLKFYDNYLLKWELQLLLIVANVMKDNRKNCEESRAYEVIEQLMLKFGDAVGKTVSEYVENNSYCLSYSANVIDKMTMYVNELLRVIYREMYEDDKCQNWSEYLHNSLRLVSTALVKFQLAETHLLAVQLLPIYPDNPCDELMDLVTQIAKHPSIDVQLYVHQNFKQLLR